MNEFLEIPAIILAIAISIAFSACSSIALPTENDGRSKDLDSTDQAIFLSAVYCSDSNIHDHLGIALGSHCFGGRSEKVLARSTVFYTFPNPTIGVRNEFYY